MPESTPQSSSATTSLDYAKLVRFLVEPLLESPESLSINCEQANRSKRVWIRVAFEGEEQGRVYGRGGRNIQAIRTVLETAAKRIGQTVYLDIYGSHGDRARDTDREPDAGEKRRRRKDRPRRSSLPRPTTKPRSH